MSVVDKLGTNPDRIVETGSGYSLPRRRKAYNAALKAAFKAAPKPRQKPAQR